MMIYRVNQIHKIIRPGFFHRNAYQFVPWPFESDGYEITASRWLHNNLIKISQVYRSRHRNLLPIQTTSTVDILEKFTRQDFIRQDFIREQFIREEENLQRSQFERRNLWDMIPSPPTASAQFIGQCRYENLTKRKLCDKRMAQEENQCSICLEKILLNENFAQWPCPSTVRHLFHFDCMLNCLRVKNTCPLCRHPVEASSLSRGRTLFRFAFR